MYKKTKIHAGFMADCLVCTKPEDRRKKKFEKKVKKDKGDLYSTLKKTVAEEAGEEGTPTELFALNQKYGVNEAKVETVSEEESKRKQRWLGQQFIQESLNVKKPSFKEDSEWKTEQQEWVKAIKPLQNAWQYKKPTVNKAMKPVGAYQRFQKMKQYPQKPLPTSAPKV